MKILVHGKTGNLFGGFQPQAEKAGHQWIWWEEEHTPAFDIFEKIKPGLFIGDENQSRAVQKCLIKDNVPAIFQFDNNFSFGTDNGNVAHYPLLVDTVNYYPECPGSPELICDLACCEEPHDAVLNCTFWIGYNNVKIFSPIHWPIAQYLGNADNATKLRLYRSARWVFANTAVELSRAIGAGVPCITYNKELWESIEQHTLFSDDIHGLADFIHITKHEDGPVKKDIERDDENRRSVLESQQYVIDEMKLTYEQAWKDLMELI